METSSSNSSNGRVQIKAYYHVNEDDMILMDDILMCPFVFRTQDAVLCGALAECVMPGMLRANFSQRNKLKSLEMTYDAMGFMQQLERASGSETTAQIIPGSLEMALSPASPEARVITMAQPPYQIVSVNEAWTKLTKYTQMEIEGMELFKVLQGEPVDGQAPNAPYDLQEVGEGRPNCATRFHYDKDGEQFVDFICSYPLTK
jgi:PAS domain-containing protein